MLGKQVIHPNQIDIVNQAFSPSAEKIEWAKELVMAFEKQSSEGIVSTITLRCDITVELNKFQLNRMLQRIETILAVSLR